jgi:hypothetical protein
MAALALAKLCWDTLLSYGFLARQAADQHKVNFGTLTQLALEDRPTERSVWRWWSTRWSPPMPSHARLPAAVGQASRRCTSLAADCTQRRERQCQRQSCTSSQIAIADTRGQSADWLAHTDSRRA